MEYQHHYNQQQRGYPPPDMESSSTSYMPNYAPRYVMLSDAAGSSSANLRPPPYRRTIPRYHSKHSHGSRSSCFCKCICCSCASLFLLLLILVGVGVYFYVTYQPKIPNYGINSMKVTAFNLNPDFSLYTEFMVVVKAENPNDKVSIIYGKEGAVAVTYKRSTLSYGHLPAFRQGHRNTTVFNVVLKGNSEFGSGLQEALMDNRRSGRIPLDIYIRVPVSLLLDKLLETMQIKVVVHCALVVDSLTPGQKPNILSSKYDVKVKI